MSDVRARLCSLLEADSRVRFAYLFGSRASGHARSDSDWDLAVYLDDALDPGARLAFRRTLTADLHPGVPVDVVVLNDASPLLAAAALAGERLFVRDRSAFVRFFVKTLGAVEDERHFARIHAVARRKRLREGGFGRPRDL